MAYDSVAHKVWQFGGYQAPDGLSNSLCYYDVLGQEWVQVAHTGNVPKMVGQTAAVDVNTGKLFVMGGCAAPGAPPACFLNDLWVFDPTSNAWTVFAETSSARPYPRAYASLAFDTKAKALLVWGGMQEAVPTQDGLWAYTDSPTSTWTNTSYCGNGPVMWGSGTVWDQDNQRMYIFSGAGVGPDGLSTDLLSYYDAATL